MSDLHAAISTAIDQRAVLANAATFDANTSYWTSGMFRTGSLDISEHIATWDPATVLRGLAEDRDILARHAPWRHETDGGEEYGSAFCSRCQVRDEADNWPCDEILSLARRLGVEVS